MNRKLLGSVIALSMLLIGAASVQASTRVSALPPRPTPVPTATPIAPVYAAAGSFIKLTVETPVSGLWTVVEWQDAIGNWHPVVGWLGTLEPDGTKTWWVAPADRGKGPFRWLVYVQRDGQLWGRSQAFYLPTANRSIVPVKVTATP